VKATCLALESDCSLRTEAESAALAAWRAGGGPFWIHLAGGTPEEILTWLAGLGLDQELLDQLHIGEDQSRILPLDEAVFFAYPVPASTETGKHAHFAFLCLDRLVITMHESPDSTPVFEDVPLARLKIREATTAGLVCGLAMIHALRLRRHGATLRREGETLDRRMDADPAAIRLREILALKRRVMALSEVADEEIATLDVLKVSNRAVLPLQGHAEALQVAAEMTRATQRDIDRQDRRIGDLQRRYEAAQQEQTNRRLGLLTAISAIFMPLTLIAGIYGMNFEFMPELHFRYGYPLVLLAMAVIARVLYVWIRSRWLMK